MLNSPLRYTALIAACILLMVAGFVAGDLRPVYTCLPLLALCFACVVAGVLGMFWTAYMLREDVRNERWREGVLAPYRAVTGHVLWKVGMGVLLAAMLLSLLRGRHHHPYFWAVLFLLQVQTQLTDAFNRPRKPLYSGKFLRPGARIDWSRAAPLRSEHWGQR